MDFGISEYDRAHSDVMGFSPDWRDLEDEYPYTVPFPETDREQLSDWESWYHSGHDHAVFSFGTQCVVD